MTNSPEFVAHGFVRAINRQDADALAGMMTEEHRFIDSLGNAVAGREAVRNAWLGYFRMVPDYSIAVEETLCDTAGPSPPLRSAQDDSPFLGAGQVVVLLGVAQGTYSPDGKPRPENRWETPAALRAVVEDGLVAEWRVYADNEPIRRLMR